MFNMLNIPDTCRLLTQLENLGKPFLYHMPDNTAKTYSYIVNRFTAYGSKYGYNVKTQKVTLFTSIEELPTVAVKLIFTKKTK
ncbi:hypothetical protein CPT_Michonne121 [Citrobacter phage Michonne]|uniref:Uncharacterized protein n=3 Tax=Mooglevirus TaxID=1985303 RepID=A0A0N9SLA6_9CAUD|nr:hypothetical protein CPT_Michonne_gp108 [Citrobacter phage Michonne]YP_009199355.1 hypothetical protein AVU07_agp104 [Escherichia phage phiSUSP1]YP_009606553.1 hypothetical protein FDI02_gp023 [Citrobacter phage Mordin]AYR00861.1 hypothetical protein CPT_Maleficent_142 [Citrobacter phage Maleficent]AKU44070.1 hypothetical protein CPT_Michonne121 [Citrobacter phage Michonne]ALA06933.1 hypothetical protein Mordin_117 [Citrobacter phage Mordin]ALH46995.1 hypothetical protein [Escherichia phag